MNLSLLTPKKALKPFLKQKPLRPEIERFKTNLINLLDKITVIEQRPKDETEEHLKNDLRDFLRDTYYRESNAINTKDKKDLVIHLGKSTNSDVGVIVEAKRPNNLSEMISEQNINKKAFHELILYYFNERENGNNQLKQLVITNVNQWYIFDANLFDKCIYRNTQIKKLYSLKISDKKDNPWFYEELAKIITTSDIEMACVYFDIREYSKILRNKKKEDDRELSALYKILAPQHLLKLAMRGDSNSLDERFYSELLHIIGLEESKESGKTIIRRKSSNRNPASLIELAIEALETEDVLHRLPDASMFGATMADRVFNVSVELCITWINRILFLKLLEGQLVTYHGNDTEYKFLTKEIINDFDELFKLFHKVLAVNTAERADAVKTKYSKVPYLNSSLFDISDLEDQTIKINALDNGALLPFISNSVLKELRKKTEKLSTLEYIFQFLDAYDFSSEGTDDIQEDSKTIINASVLGKVFEKINGYKDGSIYTPGFITMYMCREVIRQALISKFNEALSHDGKTLFNKFDDIRNYTARLFKTEDILHANSIVNSLRICDPSVGSGHFLVSALNELIFIKSELGLLADQNGNCITQYEIEIVNDELIITNPRDKDSIIDYKLHEGKPPKEMQHLQKTLFHEKQTIIENCLFGVDINTNSVKICRLRLWIELLKNAYYKEESEYTELETLPNIDINIKPGNSLLSRFTLDADLSKALKSIKHDIKAYREFVNKYKNEKSREVKRNLQKIIDDIKSDFRTEISKNDTKQIKLKKLSGELFSLLNQGQMFELTSKEKKSRKEKQAKLENDISKLSHSIEEIKNNSIYKNAFEWRFEFPEILDNSGNFEGFDVIIGNPPYIQLQKITDQVKSALEQQDFQTFTKTGDIYQLFYEQAYKLLKPYGQLAFITSNKWMRTDYGAVTRRFLGSKCKTRLVIDFGMLQLFESATTYTNILFFEKNQAAENITMCRVKEDYDKNTLLEDYVDFASVEITNPVEKSWVAYSKREYALIKKIVNQGRPLKEWDIEINYGLKTGFNEAFIIDTKTKDEIVAEDPKSADIIRPILRGEDIKAYVPKWAGLWLIAAHNGIKSKGIERIDVVNDYPAVYKWLAQFQTQLEKRYDKGDHWTNLRNCAYFEDFEKPKVIYPNMTKFLPFVYDKHQFFTNDKSFILTGFDLPYLTAFLNSKLFKFCFKDDFPELLGETREVRKVFFENVTIKPVAEAAWFKEKVEKIISLKEENQESLLYEREIEEKLFDIYELTDSERALISGNADISMLSDVSISSTSTLERL